MSLSKLNCLIIATKFRATELLAELKAASVKDSAQFDTVELILGAINPPQIDLSYEQKMDNGGDKDPYKTSGKTKTGTNGQEISFDFYVRNESRHLSSFSPAPLTKARTLKKRQKAAGLPYIKGQQLDWKYNFYNEAGTVITATNLLSHGSSQKVTVKVVVTGWRCDK